MTDEERIKLLEKELNELSSLFHVMTTCVIERCSGSLPGTAQMSLLSDLGDVMRDAKPYTERLRKEMQAGALLDVASQYRKYGLSNSFTGFDVAEHLEAEAKKLVLTKKGE